MSDEWIIQRLLSLKVRDVMSMPVVHVSAHESMEAAASAMLKRSVSGAPVIDEQGSCVGMFSAIDFMKRDARQRKDAEELDVATHKVVHHGSDNPLDLGEVNDALVAANMTSAVQTVSANTPLLQAAKELCALHVHRLPVLDGDGHPLGVISSLDIVSALLNAVDEQVRRST